VQRWPHPDLQLGICLRGKPGWVENIALITTMINAFGGQWFGISWRPQVESKPWHDAVTFYVDTLKKYGPRGSSSNSFPEILAPHNHGKRGMWVDATIAGYPITDSKQSKVAFAQAPSEVTAKGAN